MAVTHCTAFFGVMNFIILLLNLISSKRTCVSNEIIYGSVCTMYET